MWVSSWRMVTCPFLFWAKEGRYCAARASRSARHEGKFVSMDTDNANEHRDFPYEPPISSRSWTPFPTTNRSVERQGVERLNESFSEHGRRTCEEV